MKTKTEEVVVIKVFGCGISHETPGDVLVAGDELSGYAVEEMKFQDNQQGESGLWLVFFWNW